MFICFYPFPKTIPSETEIILASEQRNEYNNLRNFYRYDRNPKAKNPVAPKVPQVTINVDGYNLTIPQAAILSTNQNGYTQTDHYQVYGRLTPNSVIKATSDNEDVKFEIGKINDGRATVKATYNGVQKVYLIN